MRAYYNEIDEYAAQWLRNLIAAGHITPGDVDTRSIEDVTPADLIGYDRCHFFAGIGVWDYALNRAGWGTGEVWTGSCPCQPFSVAGKGDGFADERHLWPAFHYLIEQRRPIAVFGEQVASKDGYTWLDLVQADLEGTGYTVGAVVAPAAGFGAPHQRHRMYWVAESDSGRRGPERKPGMGEPLGVGGTNTNSTATVKNPSLHGELVHPQRKGLEGYPRYGDQTPGRTEPDRPATPTGATGGLADTESDGNDGAIRDNQREEIPEAMGRSATRGFWSAADWLYCRDEKYRPVEPGTFPLAHGATARVGRLRAYGNAIVAPQAEEFIKAYLGTRP